MSLEQRQLFEKLCIGCFGKCVGTTLDNEALVEVVSECAHHVTDMSCYPVESIAKILDYVTEWSEAIQEKADAGDKRFRLIIERHEAYRIAASTKHEVVGGCKDCCVLHGELQQALDAVKNVTLTEQLS